ncbi:MAG: radical SAM protein [Oscillibacter sp.]|nr:radical SAM protein [Oscillibacter sp.]
MHYTGTIWRPPYEADSLLLEATADCTHHCCKFCTLYENLPFRFRMSPLEDIEADLREAQLWACDPLARLSAQLQGLPRPEGPRRVFLVGANPFVLLPQRLEAIAQKIRDYLPACQTIGCFSRVTDIALKTHEELQRLRQLGFDNLTIGVETADDEALAFMDKGYTAEEALRQVKRLDEAGISYSFLYLAGISGAGLGRRGALASADWFNQTRPRIIGSSMLTVYPESRLYSEIQAGRWREESELEKLEEVRLLVERLEIPVRFATLGASNAVQVDGTLPRDRRQMLAHLAAVCRSENETELRRYRTSLRHL